MKKPFAKIIVGLTLGIVLAGILAPLALAQESGLFDTLDSLKTQVEKGGVGLVEFGSVATDWASLPQNVIDTLKANNVKNLNDFKVTGDPTKQDSEIQAISDKIKGFKGTDGSPLFGTGQEKPLGEMANLIYQEAKVLLTYDKWGGLPSDVIQTLVDIGGYESLGQIFSSAKFTPGQGNISTLDKYLLNDKTSLFSSDGIHLNSVGLRVESEAKNMGESQLQAVILSVAKVFRNLLGALAVVWIVVAGIMMIFAQGDEGKITEQKRAITYAIIGLVIVLILERMISAVYGVPGEQRALTATSALAVDTEIYALISYIKAVLGAATIFMIVISGIRTITATEEDQLFAQRRAIRWSITGLVVILIDKVLVENIFINPVRQNGGQINQTNIQNILNLFGKVLQFLLGFVGLIALASLIYGAGQMIANFGNEEMTGKAKKIITNSLIGIVILLSAFAIVSTFIVQL
jgi:Type IV secretion system pilin